MRVEVIDARYVDGAIHRLRFAPRWWSPTFWCAWCEMWIRRWLS